MLVVVIATIMSARAQGLTLRASGTISRVRVLGISQGICIALFASLTGNLFTLYSVG